MSTHSHITLITPEPLNKDLAQRWRDIVLKYLPNGVEGNANILVNGHRKQSNFYVKKIGNKLGGYVVPLTRDLLEDEAGLIAVAWDKAYPEGDFTVDFSQKQNSETFKSAIKEDILNEIAEEVAKRIHANWVTKQVNEGWNYGPRKDRIQHKDPRLLPWVQCTSSYKQSEIDRVKTTLSILESVGFNLVRR